MKFADDTKQGGVANTLEDQTKLKRNVEKSVNWALDNPINPRQILGSTHKEDKNKCRNIERG